jgi:H+-transporting ATPase
LSIDRVEAGIYPQDKLTIVQELQRQDHTVGMTGDGVNDAPSLRQADVGIAVANATDVAKAAAGLVLTEPGLHGLPLTIDAGRRVYQRLLTWTLNKLVKALQAAVLLTLGFFATSGNLIMTPRLMVLMLFANDFVTLSLASDRVRASKLPDRWDMQLLATSILPLTAYWTLFSFAVFVVARQWLRFDLPALQTLTFLTLIFTGQATIYSVRERGPFWASRPGRWLLVSSVFDVAAVSLLAAFGWLMTPLPVTVILGLLVLVALFMLPADALKVFNLKHLHTKPPSSSDTTTPKPIPSV